MIARLNSLLYRLQRARDAAGQPLPHLEELMQFLDAPPPGARDRWQQGVALCAGWGFPTTRASVYRLYQAYEPEWSQSGAGPRARAEAVTASARDQTGNLAAQQTFLALTSPHLSPTEVVSFARLEFRKESLAFERRKHDATRQDRLQGKLLKLAGQLRDHPRALEALDQLRTALNLTPL